MNIARIRILVNDYNLEGLDSLESELMAKMDDDQNDLEELGGELTEILGARQILQRVRDEGITPAEGIRDFFKGVRGVIK